jgi:hypothetical protein
MNITLTLSSSSGSFVSVDYALVDGTATTNDSDYQGGGGNVVFQPGQTTQTIPVTVFGDTNPEADEFFFVNLANPSNATLADSQGRVTVVNDDGPLPTGSPSPSGTASPTPTGTPAVSISDASVVEGNSGTSTVPLTVALSQASSMNVTVDYASHDGSATFNGADYYSQGGTLAFAPGETSKTIVATVVGDTNPEPNETFSIVLSSPNGAVIGKGTGTVTIVDDDAKAPTSTTLAIVKKPSRLKIKGTLDPPDGGEPMVVKLYERANGAFALIGLHRPMLSGATDADGNGTMESLYSTSFHRPSGGTCKVKVHFAGDASHGPSGNSATFPC